MARLLHLGLAGAVLALFVSSNFLKLASLAACAAYAWWPRDGFPAALAQWRATWRRPRIEWLLWLPVVLGLSRLPGHGLANGLRDLAFFLIPPVYFATGRRLQREGVDPQALLFRYAWIYDGLFLAGVAYQWLRLGTIDVQIVRDFVSPGSFLLVLAVFLLVRGRESWAALVRTPLLVVSVLVLASQASRTYALALAGLLLMPGGHRVSARLAARAGLAVAVAAGAIVLLGDAGELSDLVARTVAEVAIGDTWTAEDLGTRYRAFESFAALATFLSFTPLQTLLGAGFGSLVELGVTVELAGTEYDVVPWIHNGYLYVLTKTGVVGLASYLAFFGRLLTGRYPESATFGPAIVRGTILGLLLSNLVVAGWFNIESVFAFVVLGYMAAVRVQRPRPAPAHASGNLPDGPLDHAALAREGDAA